MNIILIFIDFRSLVYERHLFEKNNSLVRRIKTITVIWVKGERVRIKREQ